MNIKVTNSSGYQIANIHPFHTGEFHSVQGPMAMERNMPRNEQELIRYAKDKRLTISFER